MSSEGSCKKVVVVVVAIVDRSGGPKGRGGEKGQHNDTFTDFTNARSIASENFKCRVCTRRNIKCELRK